MSYKLQIILNTYFYRKSKCVRDCKGNPFCFFFKNKKIGVKSPTLKQKAITTHAEWLFVLGSRSNSIFTLLTSF
jgi:hypothetical protein